MAEMLAMHGAIASGPPGMAEMLAMHGAIAS
jgi:hypothetical protein